MIVIFILLLLFNSAKTIQMGFIQNVYLSVPNLSPTLIYGSCNECLCLMINSTQTIVSFNCYQNNGTCQLFNNSLYSFSNQLNDELNTTFYFLQLPPRNFTDLFWPFDGSINDESNLVYMTQKGSVSYISPGIYGQGSAMFFNDTQYLTASSPYLDTTSNGFTFEMWIYTTGSLVSGQTDLGLVGQCLYTNTSNCLHMLVRSNHSYLGFYGDDCNGNQILLYNTWYHLAFVYNVTGGLRQSIFINGQLDRSNTPWGRLNPMTNVPLTIGNIMSLSHSQGYHGYIDQLSYSSRPKSSSEILDDATLVFYFAFNNNSFLDSGPNRMIGTPYNVTLINNALRFYQSFSYFQIETFVPPNIYNTSFSVALWINPSSTNTSSIVHVSNNFSCWNMISFDNQGHIILESPENQTIIGPSLISNSWTHIAQTYSTNNGIKLYINGTLFNKTQSLDYLSVDQSCTMTVGDCSQNCDVCDVEGASYNGFIDEFRVYNRELNASAIQMLAIQ